MAVRTNYHIIATFNFFDANTHFIYILIFVFFSVRTESHSISSQNLLTKLGASRLPCSNKSCIYIRTAFVQAPGEASNNNLINPYGMLIVRELRGQKCPERGQKVRRLYLTGNFALNSKINVLYAVPGKF